MTTAAGTTTLGYDYEDRVTSITYPSGSSNSFAYNGLDTRVGKIDSTGTYSYNRDGADVTDPVLSDGHAAYTLGISQNRAGASTFELSDRLGTSTKQTNSSQTVSATRTYDAFGMLVTTTGTPVGPFGFVGDEGYQSDNDSALMLLGHRYYDPSTGRFLTRDPIQDGRNWYVYCENEPVSSIDPDGQSDLEWPKKPKWWPPSIPWPLPEPPKPPGWPLPKGPKRPSRPIKVKVWPILGHGKLGVKVTVGGDLPHPSGPPQRIIISGPQ